MHSIFFEILNDCVSKYREHCTVYSFISYQLFYYNFFGAEYSRENTSFVPPKIIFKTQRHKDGCTRCSEGLRRESGMSCDSCSIVGHMSTSI